MLDNIKILFRGSETLAYRDPACVFAFGKYRLFFTVSELKNGYLYNRIGLSESADLLKWTPPRLLTPEDVSLNYSSPGNILKTRDEWRIFFCSYPVRHPVTEGGVADETARLFEMRTKDFITFSEPVKLRPKGNVSESKEGRCIDPFVFRDKSGVYHLFFKQNGVSSSHSKNLTDWIYDGRTDGGENACVIKKDGNYLLVHSPANGIGLKSSPDLKKWRDFGITYLDQKDYEWASGRLTAGFVMESPPSAKSKYLMFFHASRASAVPETHGSATLALLPFDDFSELFKDYK